ncbi:MAG TPA: hypothetical protein PK198_18205 [Saprospiraceae bacterium]|nr:hypothetical protein [Saprospiraceae bacterium]
MKKHFFIIPAFLLTSLFAFAQSIPQGINYQAVARDSKGAPLALQNIGLRVSLRAGDAGGKAAYEEVHLLKTNELGMFQLVIGQGRTERGDFRQVPWSEHPIWMVLALDETGKGDFVTLAATQLMAVPYAFHAGTAETWSAPMTELEKNRRCSPTGIPYWTNLGNYNVNDTCHFIGTTVPVDFIFKTNNVERMRITKNGELLIVARTNFQDNVQFSGDSVIVDNDLFVGGNADVGINLSIGNDVHIGNDLQVDSNVQINNYLQVEGPSWLNNRVIVDAYIQGSQSSQDSYPLLIRGSGQGLAIQVDPSNFSPLASGRGNNYISFWNSSATMTGRVEGMSKADLDPTGLLSIVSSIITTPPSTLNMNPASILQLPTLNLFAGSAITGIDFSALSFSSNPFVTDGNLIFNTGAFNPGDFNALINSSLSSPSASFLNIYNGRDLNGTPASILWHVIQNIVCDTTTGLFPLIVGDPEAATNFKSQIFSDYSMDILQGGISTLGSLIQFAASFASPLDPEDVLSTAIGAAVEITNMVIYGSYADINLGQCGRHLSVWFCRLRRVAGAGKYGRDYASGRRSRSNRRKGVETIRQPGAIHGGLHFAHCAGEYAYRQEPRERPRENCLHGPGTCESKRPGKNRRLHPAFGRERWYGHCCIAQKHEGAGLPPHRGRGLERCPSRQIHQLHQHRRRSQSE